jgi:hypothetical protein
MGRTFESITVKALAGKAVTLSFYVRKGANFSGSTLSTAVDFGTGTDLGFTTQPTSPSSTTISTTLTASWQYVTSTIAVPTTATAARILFFYTPTGTAGAADYFEITGVQLEVGSQATPFEQRPIGTELALCQRYYEKFSATSIYTVYGSGLAGAVDSGTITMPFRVTKRVQPTLLDITGSCIMGDGVNNYTIYSLQLWTVSSPFAGGLLFTTPSSLTVGKFYSMFSNNNTTSAIAFSSEL